MKVLGFGAILWDDIGGEPAGSQGISVMGERNIGGAVFNVVAHLRRLGCEGYMLSAIGDDALGRRTFEELERLGVHRDFVGTVEAPTCLVRVSFDAEGFPRYSSPDLVSWDQIRVEDGEVRRIDEVGFDWLVFGTLEQRNPVSRAALRRVLAGARFGKVYLDLTLRGDCYSRGLLDESIRNAQVVKMNDEEALTVNRLFGFREEDLGALLRRIAREFGSQVVCITLGSRGALIGDASTVLHKPAYRVRVQDTVGSGDAFSAGLLYKLGQGAPIDESCDFANRMGALISAKRSSIPDYELSELDHIRDTLEAAL